MPQHRVVIVGGGFAGLNAATALRRAPVDVTLVDRRNFHLFQPLLYQVATGGLSPGNIAAPLRAILKRQRNCRVWLGEVRNFDLAGRRVLLADGELPYDSLILATGARTNYFGQEAWAEVAPGLKSIEDALEMRRKVLSAFEAAERETDPERHRAWLTFVIVGAGPTGVELAGTLAEIAAHTLRNEFRQARPDEARIVLVDLAPRVLGTFPEPLSEEAARQLTRKRVTLRLAARVAELDPQGISLLTGAGTERIDARTVLWAAGVQASPLGAVLADCAQCGVDRQGRVVVKSDLSLPGFPEVFVIGDLAHAADPQGQPLPGVAPVAMQQGAYVARAIQQRLKRGESPPFRYRNYGNMATIGRSAAVAQLGRFQFRGFIAWLLWLFVHLIQIVQFENRVLILFQWAWNYWTFSRSARLITDVPEDRSRS
ncbi:MAG: NAD(P)/FAD-dependent oxidoreductase [Planctomycetaceae bacterium]|nr:NAD(P)/FAD-dependent oxidoreductase [Planctomycetaceae bacterium]